MQRIASLLESEFLVVGKASNGQDALEQVIQYRPDVVVLDLGMPILNGLETTRELNKMPSPPAVVICSSHNDTDIVEAAREAGAIAYVLKSCMGQHLVEAVKLAVKDGAFTTFRCKVPALQATTLRDNRTKYSLLSSRCSTSTITLATLDERERGKNTEN